MSSISKISGVLVAVLFAAFWAVPAEAQATRTWISGVGDDVNPCSRTAPCKTFPGAISKTASGGEIDCLDPGGFGGVTVTKPITLDCGGGIGGQVGSILVSAQNGITINCNVANCLVKVRNLTINGVQQATTAGLSGIQFRQGGALIVEHVGIFGMGGTAGANAGVDFQPCLTAGVNTLGKLAMVDVEVQYGTQDGVMVKPQGTCGATAVLDRVTAFANGAFGLEVNGTATTSGTGSNVTASRSNFSGNGTGAGANSSTTAASLMLTNDVIANNTSIGIVSNGTNVTNVRVGASTISGNNFGVIQGGTSVLSTYGDNYMNANSSSEAFPSAAIGRK